MNCPVCGERVEKGVPSAFRDEVAFREFQHSGMCQPCQDELFKEREDGDAG